jgi:hypothetical protein
MKNINSIKGLINKEELQAIVDTNKDEYGRACVSVAVNVMKRLDKFVGDFNIGYYPDLTTTHGIICKCDDQGGITGFMAENVRNIVTKCHSLGWKFFLAYSINPYNVDEIEDIDRHIGSVVNAGLCDYNEAKLYTYDLIKRYKTNNQKQNKWK